METTKKNEEKEYGFTAAILFWSPVLIGIVIMVLPFVIGFLAYEIWRFGVAGWNEAVKLNIH